MVQIKSFGVLQTAKFAAVMYFILTAIFMIPFALIVLVAGSAIGGEGGFFGGLFGGVFMIFMPIVYGVLGFVFVAIVCLLYNVIAKFVGGIEIELENPQSF